jgi:predicted MFS family arabinose efflux permease
VRFIFLVIFLTSFFVRMGQGLIPALSTALKEDFGITNTELGTLGSFVYLGCVFGSMFAMPCYDQLNTKYVLIFAVVCQMGALSVFMFSTNYYWLAFARFLAGLFQVFVQILAPVWVDVYGPKDRKTKWLTFLIGSGPLGMVAGYLLAATVVSFWNWKWAFAAKIIILGCLVSVLIFLNGESIDVSRRQTKREDKKDN